MEKYLMGIDAGNTSSKVVIFDLYGKMIATAATPSMHFKRRGEGFEEFDVTELWNLISVCIKEAVEKAAVAQSRLPVSELLPLVMELFSLIKKDMPLRQAVFHRIIVPTVLLKCIREKEHTKRLMIL